MTSTWRYRPPKDGSVALPLVGGPRHGRTFAVREPVQVGDTIRIPRPFQIKAFTQQTDPYVDGPEEVDTYRVRKMVYTLPGRCDRQMFPVLAHSTVGWSDYDVEVGCDAILKAWEDGWAPAGSTSETWRWPAHLTWDEYGYATADLSGTEAPDPDVQSLMDAMRAEAVALAWRWHTITIVAGPDPSPFRNAVEALYDRVIAEGGDDGAAFDEISRRLQAPGLVGGGGAAWIAAVTTE